MKLLAEEEAARMVNEEDIQANAVERVEQHGIVFLDEMDKIAGRSDSRWGRCLARRRAARLCYRWWKAAR